MYAVLTCSNLKNSMKTVNIHTSLYTKPSFELEKPSWGRKLQNVIKNGCTIKEYRKTVLALFMRCKARVGHV